MASTGGALPGANQLPIGTILMFVGDTNHLPDGWFLCNGLNGTVDLTNRMPIGLGVGATVVSGPQAGSTGPYTGPGSGDIAPSNLWTAGNAEQTPAALNHRHALPVTSVFFIQRVR